MWISGLYWLTFCENYREVWKSGVVGARSMISPPGWDRVNCCTPAPRLRQPLVSNHFLTPQLNRRQRLFVKKQQSMSVCCDFTKKNWVKFDFNKKKFFKLLFLIALYGARVRGSVFRMQFRILSREFESVAVPSGVIFKWYLFTAIILVKKRATSRLVKIVFSSKNKNYARLEWGEFNNLFLLTKDMCMVFSKSFYISPAYIEHAYLGWHRHRKSLPLLLIWTKC